MTTVEHPSWLSFRLYRLLEDRGGSATHAHLVQYLAELLHDDEAHVRDVLLEEVAAGRLHLTWADPDDDFRHTVEIAR